MTSTVSHLSFTPTNVYVCIYYISGRKWYTTHIAQISLEKGRHNIYASMKTMWPPYYRINRFAVPHAPGTWWIKLERYIMHQRLDLPYSHVVGCRAHCFHDCINLVLGAIFKTSFFPLIAKRCAGDDDLLQEAFMWTNS